MFDLPSRSYYPSRRLDSSRRGAFSLLEVAIALVIFVIGAIALLRIFPGGLDVLEDTGNRRTAAQMSQNVLTSYQTGGDLAATTPDAIYEADDATPDPTTSFAWQDYPLSLTGLRRDQGTIPTDIDSFGSSAADHLRHIRGEKQTPLTDTTGTTSCFTNYVVDRQRVGVYREGTVSGVQIDANTGQLDFKAATYSVSNRKSVAAGVQFREPYIGDSASVLQLAPTPVPTPPAPAPTATPVPSAQTPSYSSGTFTIYRASYPSEYDATFALVQANAQGDASGVTVSATTSTGDVPAPTVTASATSVVLHFSVPADTGQAAEEMPVDIITPNGISTERKRYIFTFVGTGGPPSTPTAPGNILPIRAPLNPRDNVTFYPSTIGTTGGSYRQPMTLPTDDSAYDQTSTALAVPTNPINGTIQTTLAENLAFRQYLDVIAGQGDRVRIKLASTSNYVDVQGAFPPSDLAQVSLDYNVLNWEYLTEYTSQFGTPFPGDDTTIGTTSADDLVWRQFVTGSNVPTPLKRSQLSEIRTSIGNLRGPIYIKGIYQTPPSTDAFSADVQFDPRDTPATYASLTAAQQRAFRKRMAAAASQGRFYLPSQTTEGNLQSARLYYRSRDGWAQQIGIAASHYLPYSVTATIREPWREYFHAADGYVYFRAPEAGKTLVYTHKVTNAITGEVTYPEVSLEVKPDVLFVAAMPSNVPATFATAKFTNTSNANDPRNGKFYLARSRDPISDNIYDIRRASGSSGISVRTLWLNAQRYAQEVAQ